MFLSLTILNFALLPLLISADHDEFDYYDVNEVHDEFLVHCGTANDPYMRITYGGDAHSVYAAADPDNCKATEMGPAVWVIDIEDFEDTNCPVLNSSTGGAPLRMLDVVVQMGSVRQWSDSYKQIICNYGLGGQQVSADTEAIQGVVEKQPVWENAQNSTSDDVVSLHVYDTADVEVVTARLGHYIQLRAFLETNEDRSIKVFNCRAYSGLMSYYILVGGCGEGDVIDIDRGFRTRNESVTGQSDVSRVARSSYFKSFLLPGEDTLTFECDYILCDPSECDGYSCVQSVMLDHDDRKRRAVHESYSHAVPATNSMPKVLSNTIRIVPQTETDEFVVSANDLIRAEESTPRRVPIQTVFVPTYQEALPETELPTENGVATTEELDLLTIGLVAALCVLAVVLMFALTCTVMLCRRQQLPWTTTLAREDYSRSMIYSPPAKKMPIS